jgi:hypothetical protein
MASTTPSSSNFFEDDDEETLRYLLTNNDGEGGGEAIASRLETLSKRFMQDHQGHGQYDKHWNALVESAQGYGFDIQSSKSGGPKDAESSEPFPSAFQSEAGQKHLQATAAILNVSERRAVQLTMSSIRSLNETTNIQALLGTRTLLVTVMAYHFKQRIARLSTIAECLRKEQDSDASGHASIVQILDSIDSSYVCGGNNRGIFRILLSIACQPDDSQTPSRDELLPSKELRDDSPASLQESFTRPSDQLSWRQFVANCTNANRRRIHQERVEALEALVVLLYYRIHNGVGRADYLLLLLAFQSANAFFTAYPDGDRLSLLSSLVCAESMGLWRVFDDDSDGVAWVESHPLFHGLLAGPTSQAEQELETLRTLLLNYSGYANDRAAPESLALLSMGSLWVLAYNSILAAAYGSDENGYWQVRLRHVGTQKLLRFLALTVVICENRNCRLLVRMGFRWLKKPAMHFLRWTSLIR